MLFRSQDGDDVDLNQSNLDLFKAHEPVKNVREASYWQKEGIMSLDISEYELQMLEMQANEEHRKEQSTLDLKVQNCPVLLTFNSLSKHPANMIF